MIRTVRKAVTAATFAGVGTLGGTMLDGDLTGPEALFSLGTALVAGAATWRVPNARRRTASTGGEHRAPGPAV